MRLNPIVKKDIKVQSRSMKMSWGVFSYELILALVFFLSMLIIRNRNMYSTDNIYSAMVWLYPVLAVTQFVILGIVTPVRTASSISGEKERQTFDIMMTTSMSPFSVIIGKVMTRTGHVLCDRQHAGHGAVLCHRRNVLELSFLVPCDIPSDLPFLGQHRDSLFLSL